MDNSKEAMNKRIQEWKERIRVREESGMTINAYCETEGIPRSQYYYWVRRIKQNKRDNGPREIVDVTDLIKGSDDEAKNVVTVAKTKSKTSKGISIFCFKLDENASTSLIAEVIKAIANA